MGDAIHDISSGSPALLAGCAFGLVALLLGHILNSSTNRTTWTLAGTGVGARALTPHRQTAPVAQAAIAAQVHQPFNAHGHLAPQDRKSTRLNSSHVAISYAVFCLKK